MGGISISFYLLFSNKKLWWAFYLPPFVYFTKVGFSWQPRNEKTFPICFVLSELTTKFFEFFVFSFMAYGNLATSPTRLETELTNITRRHFCSLPVVCIEHSFIYFLLSIFLSVICLFRHTLTARDNTRDRDANSSRQNDVT